MRALALPEHFLGACLTGGGMQSYPANLDPTQPRSSWASVVGWYIGKGENPAVSIAVVGC